MVLIKFSLRELASRPLRVALTTLSIVIAVAAVVSVSIATKTARVGQERMFAAVAGRTSLEVIAAGGSGFDFRLAAELEKLPGVQAVPVIRRYSIVYLPEDKKVRVQILGVIPERDRLVRDWELESGKIADDGTGVMLDAPFAKNLGVKLGDSLRMLTPSGLRESEVVGLLVPRSGAAVLEGGLIYMPLGLAQSRFRMRDRIDALQIVLDDGVDLEQTEQAVARQLPEGLTVRRPALQSGLADGTMLATELGLKLATAFALVIAAFIIFNTFQMAVGERRRQLGILRAIGATRGQVQMLILREGMVIGLVGSAVGSLVGLLGAHLLTIATAELLQTDMPAIQVTVFPFLLALGFGLGLTFFATYLPARRSGSLSPLEAMQAVPPGEMEGASLRTTIGGAVLVAAGVVLLFVSMIGWLPVEVAVDAVVLLLIGMVLLLPVSLGLLAGIVYNLVRPVFGVEGRIAQRQLLRHRGRTAMTIGMLFIAMATGVGMANTIFDNVGNVHQWYQQAIVGDFFVRALMPDMATGKAADMPAGLDQEIAAIPGVLKLDTISFKQVESGEELLIAVIRNFTQEKQVYFELLEGEWTSVRRQLFEGQIVVGSVYAQKHNLKMGDLLPVKTREGVKELRIAGVVNDYIAGGMTLYMQRTVAQELLGVEGVDAYIVQADHSQLKSVQSALEELCDKHGLMLQSYADLVDFIERMMNGVVAGLWALLALGSVIAAFGLVNTLTMNILEQTREFAVLRVVAMTRRQVRRTILAQAVIMGLVGLAPGVLMGVLVAYLINLSTLPTTGRDVSFLFRPWLFTACFVGAFVVVLASAFLPAERAARIKLSKALQSE
ncbi:FtsX-like permease family protein [Lignipirellula cremea]|uniref:ABC transporter permease YtrF n=1 Tax=Lignipirellula cremea TaxID=2528010 RepID=A0A518E3H0_9BACT|nr:FtsX-like permease family protein [Lignipirellula cremea]QDU98645.1 ABC transporter permease YtrF precursor [Lignipirellula cremea]